MCAFALADTGPIFLNWEFWTAIAAVLALVLSQVPPLHLWFKPRRLEVEVQSRIQVTHLAGNPNLGMVVSVRNTGGRELRVRAIKVALMRDETALGNFPAQNYFENFSSQSTVLFVPFLLKPDETWAHGTNFLNLFDRPTEKLYREGRFALREDILHKRQALPKDDTRDVLADPALVTPFVTLFERLFIWHPGEYVAELTVVAEPGTATFRRKYRFTLYESDSAELRSFVGDYKFGGGIAYNVERHIGLMIPLAQSGG